MSLLAHINTADLAARHDDILKDVFPGTHLQSGSDGVIIDETLPCDFTAASLNLCHYIPDEMAEELNNSDQAVPIKANDLSYPLPLLNVDNTGFYKIIEIKNNNTAVIAKASPAITLRLNRAFGANLDDSSIASGEKLGWSLGGWELKIATAYADLVTELIKRGALTADYLDDNDPSYVEALTYHSLELVYTALITNPGDTASLLSARYHHLYNDELTRVKPYGYDRKARLEVSRC